MRIQFRSGIIATCVALAASTSASAQSIAARRLHLPAQPLRASLQDLARLYRVELLFSDDAVGDQGAPALDGSFRLDQALAELLRHSEFDVRRSGSGSYIVVKTAQGEAPSAAGAPVPEIVVTGRRTQNADIRRFTNDVQPYQVLEREDIRNAHAGTVEELLGKRTSAASRGLSLVQTPVSGQGSPQSTIDLRGLGADETLVLIDGRRMPRLPTARLAFAQSDLNGVSPDDVERVEVATSTAGGIYGPGAIAGVVNLVLRRNYRGAEIGSTTGITERGDALSRRLDVRVGFTPDDGATDVMVSYSRTVVDGLRVRDRDFLELADARAFERNANQYWYGDLPASNSVNVASSTRSALTLKPEYGGGSLNSFVSFLPQGNGRSQLQVGALLLANSGNVDLVPSSSDRGGLASLTTGHAASSTLANIRHRFGSLEIYGDFIRLVDSGTAAAQNMVGIVQLAASDPRNPFQQAIDVSFPTTALSGTLSQRIVTTRASFGAVANLPQEWKGNLDISLGAARQDMRQKGETLTFDAMIALQGYASAVAAPIDLFGDSAALQQALAKNAVAYAGFASQTNRMTDLSLRLAGPVATLGAGRLFVTLLAEQRRERVDATTSSGQYLDVPYTTAVQGYGERVRSGYVEARLPLIAESARFALARGLEFQLAARVDSTRVDVTADPGDDPNVVYQRFQGKERAAFVYSAGFKIRPLPNLMVRASIATGEMAPPLNQSAGTFLLGLNYPDPKRGNQLLGSEQPYKLVVFKDPLIPERARSISLGFVTDPFGARGPTLSLDYSSIRRSREAAGRGGMVFTFITQEALYPGRVKRLPLTPEDAAKGYTAGVVTEIDSTYTTTGWTKIDAIDGRLAMPFRLERGGDIVLHVAGTWQPYYRRFVAAGSPVEDLTNRIDGALALRGNSGVDWSDGTLGLGLAAQFYGAYSVESGGPGSASVNLRDIALQGASRIPASVTFDLSTSYRFRIAGVASGRQRMLDVRLGIQDLLDRRPATVLNAEGSYSIYADPRRRRFELSLTAEL